MFELTKIPVECDYDVARDILKRMNVDEMTVNEKSVLKVVTEPLLIDHIRSVERIIYDIQNKTLSWYTLDWYPSPHTTAPYIKYFHASGKTTRTPSDTLPARCRDHLIELFTTPEKLYKAKLDAL